MEIVRVSLNLPKQLTEKVEGYAKEMGLNKTSAYIILLNQALTQIEMQKNVPEFVNAAKDLERIATIIKYNTQ